MVLDRLEDLGRIGRSFLLERPLDALRWLVNPSSIAHDVSANASRQTVYAAFKRQPGRRRSQAVPGASPWDVYENWYRGGRDPADAAVLAAVIEAMDLDWGALEAPDSDLTSSLSRPGTADPRQRLVEALRSHIDRQFEMPGVPVGLFAHGAALTAAPQWRHAKSAPQGEERDLGEAILEARRRQYQEATNLLMPFMQHAMNELGRTPDDGDTTARSILALMHALMDGAILRTTIDPDALSPELIAEAMVRLGEAFSRRGASTDPHRPSGVSESADFDRVVSAAAAAWRQESGMCRFPSMSFPDVSRAEVEEFFLDSETLAESVLWREVGAIEPADELDREAHALFLARAIQRLKAAAASHPAVVDVARGRAPEHGGYFYELQIAMANALGHVSSGCDATSTARSLIEGACTGGPGRAMIHALNQAIPLDLPLNDAIDRPLSDEGSG